MNIKERWLNFIMPHIHRMMEWAKRDPDISYDDWLQLKKNYRDTVGREYE